MRISDRETLDGDFERITVVPETVDDLWHLQYVIEPSDRVAGDTTRRIQRAEDHMRDTGGQRESMWLALAVETVEFHRFANRLRIGGEIVACSREDQLGHHHTLNIETHDELSIEKRFKPDQLERLEEAVESAEQPDVAIATVEEGRAHVHTVAAHGTEEKAAITASSGKNDDAPARSELFEELGTVLSRMDVDAIILAGPGFTKQDAADALEDMDQTLASKLSMVDTASVGDRGVHEVLTRGAVAEVRDDTRIEQEAALLDDLTDRIANGAKATYGPEAVAEAADYGAVDQLLILDESLRQERGGEGDWPIDVDSVVRSVEQQGGEVVIFSSEFAPGRQLQNLGGIAALLRYRLE